MIASSRFEALDVFASSAEALDVFEVVLVEEDFADLVDFSEAVTFLVAFSGGGGGGGVTGVAFFCINFCLKDLRLKSWRDGGVAGIVSSEAEECVKAGGLIRLLRRLL
jgi:hypothetical protein